MYLLSIYTVYCTCSVFILCTVPAQIHMNYFYQQNAFIYSLFASIFIDIMIVNSLFNNPEYDCSVL